MEHVDEPESVIVSAPILNREIRERKISVVSMNVEEKRSDSISSPDTPRVERKLSKSASEGSSSPVVIVKRGGSKASDPKTKEEKKKKRSSIVSFAERHYHALRKKDSSASKSSDKDEVRTPPVGSPSPPIKISSPMACVRMETLEELAALAGEAAAVPAEKSATDQELVAKGSVDTDEHIYDTVPPLSPVAEVEPASEQDGVDSKRPPPTASEQRDSALRAALGLPSLRADRLEWARRAGLSWLPDGLAAEDAEEFWPPEQTPWLNSAGARLRQVSLLHQLPAADLRRPDAGPRLADFAATRDRVALGEGRVLRLEAATACGGCGEEVPAGQLAVTADLLPAFAWHPACFNCTTCGQRLADLLYCHHRGQPLCVRHFGDKLKDRCVSCDELIFDGEFRRAGEMAWHIAHLICAGCEAPLAGKQFGLHGRQTYCLSCYETASLGSCDGCGLALRPVGRRLRHGSRQWHPACFACSWCATPLEGHQFALREGRPVCAGCSSQPVPPPCPRCDVCSLPVAADSGLVEYKAGRCHDTCFICCVCSVALGERTFMPKEQKLYCSRCYEETFSTRCAKCNNTITSLGLTFQGETWHRECFLCCVCKTSLAGRKFRSDDKKPFCKDCYRDAFGKRCSRCHGFLEGRYSAFQNRSWHNECFTCVDCGGSLVGTGFIDIDGDVLCQNCALHRQMAELDQ